VNELDLTSLSERIWTANLPRQDLVRRIADAIREQIVFGRLAPGAKLVPEGQLALNLHVSRPSLREAIRVLAHEGLLLVKHGVGTFVSKEARVLGPLERMQSMSELIRAAGGAPAHRDLQVELIGPTAHIAGELGLAPGARIGRVSRVRLMDDIPFVLAHEYVVLGEAPRTFATLERFDTGSLYEFLRREFGVEISHSMARISAIAADTHASKLLNLKKGAPLLVTHELHYERDGRPVLLTINHHNTQVVEFITMRSGMRL
jgi:DNA-binding GntR family transcriptional regulator